MGVCFLSSSFLLAVLLSVCLPSFLLFLEFGFLDYMSFPFLLFTPPSLLPSSCLSVTVDAGMLGGRRNLEDMLRVPWHVAIFDEAHKLKNRRAKIYEACCQLPTKLRYGLTGTAMQVR